MSWGAGNEAPGASDPGAGAGEANGTAREGALGIAAALAEISERATLLIHEEIELAKAEVTQKVTRIARGAVVSIAAGVFIVTAVAFALIGCAWLLYYYLPIGNANTYFWGFFAMAVIMLVLGLIAGLIAARVLRSSTPPVPEMAIEEARRIRETVSNGSDSDRQPPPGPTSAWSVAPASPPVAPVMASAAAPAPDPPQAPSSVRAAFATEPEPAAATPVSPTIDDPALQADPTADASRVPTDELGPPPAEPPDTGESAREAS